MNKEKNTEKVAEFIQKSRNVYFYQTKNSRVKIVFSDALNAQAIEDILVKVAVREAGFKA